VEILDLPLVETGGRDRRVVFLLFTPLYDSHSLSLSPLPPPLSLSLSLYRRADDVLLDPLGGCESSRLFKGWFLSSLHRAGANFPPGPLETAV